MIRDGAEPWNSPMDEEFSSTMTVPGLYGYVCLQHYEMGIVGMIIVGDDLPNIDEAKKTWHSSTGRATFCGLFEVFESAIRAVALRQAVDIKSEVSAFENE